MYPNKYKNSCLCFLKIYLYKSAISVIEKDSRILSFYIKWKFGIWLIKILTWSLNTGIHSCSWKDDSCLLRFLMAWMMFQTNLKLCFDLIFMENKPFIKQFRGNSFLLWWQNVILIHRSRILRKSKFAAKHFKLFIVFTNWITKPRISCFKTYLLIWCFMLGTS